ncbi:MAG: hypothetical protein KDC38_03475 [Planctomycetes bacterium]|nr:hypothetical protein [Planctomycetota bacterium]
MATFLQSLFSRRRLRLDDLQDALQEVDRERRRVRVEMRRWERQRRLVMERLKRARSTGNSVEVDYLWDELKAHRVSGHDLRREARGHNLEGLALRRAIRAIERLETQRDRIGAQRLLERFRESGVLERLALHDDSRENCLHEVSAILEELGGDSEPKEDPEKAMFMAELDAISSTTGTEEPEASTDRERELLERFQAHEPE